MTEHAPMTEVIAVRSGSFKAYKDYDQGQEYILGFYFPGDIAGLEASFHGKHLFNLTALETSAVCSINYSQLIDASRKIPALQQHLLEILSEKLSLQYMINPQSRAIARMARLLLSISNSHQKRGLSATQFYLSMPRKDIAHYLGIAPETVSRLLTEMGRLGLVEAKQKEITLLDIAGLQELL